MRLRVGRFVFRFCFYAVLVALMPSSSTAEEQQRGSFDPELDPIHCVLVVDSLVFPVPRSLFEPCFAVPALVCMRQDDPSDCIASETETVTRFLQNFSMKGLQSDEPLARTDCKPGVPDVICEFTGLFAPTLAHFRPEALREPAGLHAQSGLDLSVYSTWDASHSITCLAMSASMPFEYRIGIQSNCGAIGKTVCEIGHAAEVCLANDADVLSSAVAETLELLRERIEDDQPHSGIYRIELDSLEASLSDADLCVPQPSEDICDYISVVAVLGAAFRLAYEVDPAIVEDVLAR